jgi:hypothetical protein
MVWRFAVKDARAKVKMAEVDIAPEVRILPAQPTSSTLLRAFRHLADRATIAIRAGVCLTRIICKQKRQSMAPSSGDPDGCTPRLCLQSSRDYSAAVSATTTVSFRWLLKPLGVAPHRLDPRSSAQTVGQEGEKPCKRRRDAPGMAQFRSCLECGRNFGGIGDG